MFDFQFETNFVFQSICDYMRLLPYKLNFLSCPCWVFVCMFFKHFIFLAKLRRTYGDLYVYFAPTCVKPRASQVTLVVKNVPDSAGRLKRCGFSLKDPLEEDTANPLQYSFLESFMDSRTCRLQSTGLHRVRNYWSDLACMRV